MNSYGPDTKERQQLQEALDKWKDKTTDIPIVIGDEEFRTPDVRYQVMVKTQGHCVDLQIYI
jgi:1-pyrroline-5-carboxylate dehydrogenase